MGHSSHAALAQLGPQQLRYMALRSDSSAPACLRPSSAAARAAASAAAWGARPASRSRARAPAPAPAAAEGALSRCARTAATVAAAHTRLMCAIQSQTRALLCLRLCAASFLVRSLRSELRCWSWEVGEGGSR
ncbi:unnamed protein product [Miscanthus lutarioriparius]|uniref:Uncharacterized protein n=1 Tax=Miscanthus lutarioriparius TaxID=422564 RepID=A0A811N158_9POAL|nr:unnamed protein product [Miscanthus lutarioriparius]